MGAHSGDQSMTQAKPCPASGEPKFLFLKNKNICDQMNDLLVTNQLLGCCDNFPVRLRDLIRFYYNEYSN